MFDRLEHFDKELAKYGINEVSEGCAHIEQQPERVNLYASLVGAERWPFTKEPVVLEHDAKCRLLVERLRGHGNVSLSNARYWFLTYDTKLPRFAKRVPDNGDRVPGLPFCVSPSAWVQIIRALTPRTEDFDRTVVDLLTSPFVGYRRAVSTAVVREVVGRMDHFGDAAPEIAIAVLTDTAAVGEIEAAVGAEDDEAVEETIKAAYNTKARELQNTLESSEERVAEVERALADAETKAASVDVERKRELEAAARAQSRQREQAEAAQAELRHERAEIEIEKRSLEQRITEVRRDRDSAKTRADEADRRIGDMETHLAGEDQRRRRNKRIIAGAAIALLGAAVGLALALVVFSDTWAIGGASIGGAALVLLGTRIAVGEKLGGELVKWGSLLAGLAAIVVAIVRDRN